MEQTRQPIVTVLGHVDHGKTTLLDAIRKTRVASGEAGGITQSIGASLVQTKDGKKITFIDTPGHAAFSKMRARGATVADIAVLVVAADDGPMPQTKEAIKYIQEAKIPFVVALTKIDLPSANVESSLGKLEKEGIFLEGRGGDVPHVSVSAKKGQGIDELLEVIGLVAEVSEVKADKKGPLEAVVIETGKDKRGMIVSLVVRNGTLKVGEEVSAGSTRAKVRGLFNDETKSVREIYPGEPALLLGFSTLPDVGSIITNTNGSGSTAADLPVKKLDVGIQKDDKSPKVIIKAQNQGVLEAILGGIDKRVKVIDASVGELTESDIFLAKSTSADIIVFASKVPSGVKKLADTESVKVAEFEIIYELFKHLEDMVIEREEKILGKAEVIKMFPLNPSDDKASGKKGKSIAGCKVIDGVITKKDILTLSRGDKRLGQVKIISMKKEKKEVQSVQKAEEFGIYFEPQFDFRLGDMLISVATEK